MQHDSQAPPLFPVELQTHMQKIRPIIFKFSLKHLLGLYLEQKLQRKVSKPHTAELFKDKIKFYIIFEMQGFLPDVLKRRNQNQ